ncbi:hypothetical protein BD414DRAFT_495927 [Trametes punicea]|nr:hypothetical protein BD414DRAFT_495927 [Trametes punicea]
MTELPSFPFPAFVHSNHLAPSNASTQERARCHGWSPTQQPHCQDRPSAPHRSATHASPLLLHPRTSQRPSDVPRESPSSATASRRLAYPLLFRIECKEAQTPAFCMTIPLPRYRRFCALTRRTSTSKGRGIASLEASNARFSDLNLLPTWGQSCSNPVSPSPPSKSRSLDSVQSWRCERRLRILRARLLAQAWFVGPSSLPLPAAMRASSSSASQSATVKLRGVPQLPRQSPQTHAHNRALEGTARIEKYLALPYSAGTEYGALSIMMATASSRVRILAEPALAEALRQCRPADQTVAPRPANGLHYS